MRSAAIGICRLRDLPHALESRIRDSILVVPHSSLVPFWEQISCLHENLLAERYEGSAIS